MILLRRLVSRTVPTTSAEVVPALSARHLSAADKLPATRHLWAMATTLNTTSLLQATGPETSV